MAKFPAAGATSSSSSSPSFISLDWAKGFEDLAKKMASIYARTEPRELESVMRSAAREIANDYKSLAQNNAATGNLAKSVQTKFIPYNYAAVAIAGPKHTGSGGADENGSGNHAWLIEFGTDRRRPGGGEKKPALYVHKEINGRTRGFGAMNAMDFENASSEYSYIMGSINRPFINPQKHFGPYKLKPGEDYGAMPKLGWMEDVTLANRPTVQRLMQDGIRGIIERSQP